MKPIHTINLAPEDAKRLTDLKEHGLHMFLRLRDELTDLHNAILKKRIEMISAIEETKKLFDQETRKFVPEQYANYASQLSDDSTQLFIVEPLEAMKKIDTLISNLTKGL